MKTLLIGINSKYIHPSMGIFQIVANSKTEVIYKEFTIKDDTQNIVNFIRNSNFDLLGFSVYIWNISKIIDILTILNKNIIVFLGGPEASYRPEDFFKHENVKYIIKNEAEESFNQLIEYLEGKRKRTEVSNLFYKDKTLTYTYDKIPNIKYIKHDLSLINDFKNRVVYLEASRGCPFKCSYCLASLEKSIRYFDIENIKNEILYVLNKNAKTVKFLDRSFNVNQSYIREILKFILEHDNGITTFQFEVVGDLLDKETINIIKNIRKGLIRFEIGIQSTNDVVTRSVRRVQDFNKLRDNIREINDNIIVHADLIAGLPFEDKQSFINTFNQTFELFCQELQLGFLKELKGTYISETKSIHNYNFSKKPPYEIIDNKFISKDELDEIKLVEEGLNKYYNSGNFPKTMNYLFKELNLNPYQTFLKIITYIKNKGFVISSLQHHEVSQLLYLSLLDSTSDKLLYIIKQDYLLKNKMKPKIWWNYDISKEERNLIYKEFINVYPELTIDTLYRYSRLEKYLNQYFLVTYKPQNIYFLLYKNA